MTNSEKRCLPAFDDLRHLRRKTEKGYLIVHPLVHHRAPDKPGSTPGTALASTPAGYTTTAALAARYHLPKARIRRILRARISPLWIKPHMLHRAWNTREATAILDECRARQQLPETPPPGCLTAAAVCKALGLCRSSLTRHYKAGHIKAVQGRQPGSTAMKHFYPESEVERLRAHLLAYRLRALQSLQHLQEK